MYSTLLTLKEFSFAFYISMVEPSDNIMCEISQTQKGQYHKISLRGKICKRPIHRSKYLLGMETGVTNIHLTDEQSVVL